MSDNKIECPGCGFYSSTVYGRVERGEACDCGLSADAITEINSVRQGRADERMKKQCEELLKDNDKLRREVAKLMLFRTRVESAVKDDDNEVEHW